MIVDGVDISRKYSLQEITEMYHKGRLRKVAVQGYIVRADADGMVGFVPASESTLFHSERGKLRQYDTGESFEEMRRDVEHEHPMVRRAAQKKRAAMVQRLLGVARLHGTIPGLTDEQISTMIGEKWKTGVSVVTQQMLDRVAAHLLGQGEALNKEHDRNRTTRDHALA